MSSLFARVRSFWRGLRRPALLAEYVAAMTGVCMLPCVVPARRALRIQPI